MFCSSCGKQISEDSKFCSFCGKSQTNTNDAPINERIAKKIIENKIVSQVVEKDKRPFAQEFLKKAIGWYLAWVVLHLGVLLIFSNSIMGTAGHRMDRFVPFSDYSRLQYYDIREFLFYTIFPLLVLVVWSIIKSNKK